LAAEDLVAFRAAFERYPAGLKGAFLLRGADGMPHQVRIGVAFASQIGGEGQERIAIEQAILDISPTMDTFVPFDLPTLDLLPAWYRLECEVQIDGVAGTVYPGDRFVIPWPRSQVRRGTVEIGKKVGDVTVRSLECGGDSIRIAFAAPAAPTVGLSVNGRAHPVLEVEHDPQSEAGRIIGYPVLREDDTLSIEVDGQRPVEVALP
jgi:hypothetical protein